MPKYKANFTHLQKRKCNFVIKGPKYYEKCRIKAIFNPKKFFIKKTDF